MHCISMCDLELDLNKVSIHLGGGCGGARSLHTDGHIQIFLFSLYIEYCACLHQFSDQTSAEEGACLLLVPPAHIKSRQPLKL